MTIEKMRKIIMENVSFSQLEKNKGIYEFYNDNESEKSLGISYEDIDDKRDVYIYNIFIDSEYINISGEGTKENPLPNDILEQLVKEWNMVTN